ncbi:MAG: hypothetical protein JJU46_10620 [Balneolaceae bacterium]|nr:hypothetical protein [Balneolaceae bacterium]MCH8548873.1 hypothetical protein [Balneolaceae bacterium]
MGKIEKSRDQLLPEHAGSLSLAILGVLFFMLLIAGHNESLFFDTGTFDVDTAGATGISFVSGVSSDYLSEEVEEQLLLEERERPELEIEEFILDYTRQSTDLESETRKKRHTSEWPAQAYMISF